MKTFSKEDYNFILQNCIKKDCKIEGIDKRDRAVSHCPVSLDPAKRGNIPVKKDGKIFNCCLAPSSGSSRGIE